MSAAESRLGGITVTEILREKLGVMGGLILALKG